MGNTQGLWVAVIATASFVVGIIGGTLAWIGGTPAALAVLIGAGGFAGFMTLALAIANFMARAQS
ncbi:small-conductance mechanosensitive channel [Streptosporangium becharense]|uniref:Small-conductance mechanosensitive channel n=1 Tax=Streptosporangium becharense TaxID=1816182 RepID=A0A7W9MH65_9ACTN|nr:hypothetical protein [Streptosporangium becharense]MBB2908756.1 small-conductance mechanosensitive channel [Streptosporangium becharense]MBB5820226.1 small-conductance mechanosensitive channel [Streptosporangium becharense]